MNPVRLWTAGLLLVATVAVLAGYRDYGVTWDEPVQSAYGENVLAHFRSEPVGSELPQQRTYGPAFELLAALAYAPFPDRKYEIRHLLIAASALFGVVGVVRIGVLLGAPWVAVFASLALVAAPRFSGHAFNNSKDVPFAALLCWAVYAICRFSLAPGRWLPALGCGAAMGAALAVRPGGLPLLLALFAVGAGLALWRERRPGALALRSGAAWLLAWAAMVAVWPWAHEAPLAHPLEAVATAFSFPAVFPVLYAGAVTMSDALPRSYLPVYLAITTPPLLLALAALGLVVAARGSLRTPCAPAATVSLVVAVWLLAPLVAAAATRPNVYDGMRHVLFVVPALALLAGVGAAALVAATPPGRLRRAAAAVLLVLCAAPLWQVARLHPYQSSYFNIFVGGLGGAYGRYETDYWLSSYKEAAEWLNERAAERPGRRLRVLLAADSFSRDCAVHFLDPGIVVGEVAQFGQRGQLPEPWDYYLSTTRYRFDLNYDASPVVHAIGRDGAVFSVVRARR